MDEEQMVQDVLENIMDHCYTIDELVDRFGKDEDIFMDDVAYQMSCTFLLMQIGENVKRIETWLSENSKAIKWKSVCRFRDLIAHNYGKVQSDMIWNMLDEDYPVLKSEITRLLSNIQNDQSP